MTISQMNSINLFAYQDAIANRQFPYPASTTNSVGLDLGSNANYLPLALATAFARSGDSLASGRDSTMRTALMMHLLYPVSYDYGIFDLGVSNQGMLGIFQGLERSLLFSMAAITYRAFQNAGRLLDQNVPSTGLGAISVA